MDEHQYKTTYKSVNPHRCVFEKAINSRICSCSRSHRFNLADREGVACNSLPRLERCSRLLTELREKARFALRRSKVSQTLAHANEIKIQNGGMLGLQLQVDQDNAPTVKDIDSLIHRAESQYDGISGFPYSRLMQGIIAYRARTHRHRSRKRGKSGDPVD